MDIQNLSKYLSAIETSSTAQAQSTGTNHLVQSLNPSSQNQDSYISSASQMEDVLPSSTYESILDSLAAYKSSLAEEQSSTEEASSVSGGGSANGNSDDSDTTTVVEQYRGPDGSIYLKTTTTDSEGNETVTITKLGQGSQESPLEGELPPEPPEDGEVPPPPTDRMLSEQQSTTGTTETEETTEV